MSARCQCTGQCGKNHQWSLDARPVQCRAPHGCWIQRKLDNASCWVLSEYQGEDSRGEPVRTGRLAYPEHYKPKPVQVLLATMELGGIKLALCQRCKLLIERKGSADERQPTDGSIRASESAPKTVTRTPP